MSLCCAGFLRHLRLGRPHRCVRCADGSRGVACCMLPHQLAAHCDGRSCQLRYTGLVDATVSVPQACQSSLPQSWQSELRRWHARRPSSAGRPGPKLQETVHRLTPSAAVIQHVTSLLSSTPGELHFSHGPQFGPVLSQAVRARGAVRRGGAGVRQDRHPHPQPVRSIAITHAQQPRHQLLQCSRLQPGCFQPGRRPGTRASCSHVGLVVTKLAVIVS
jgi:hypothetical protein